MYINVNLIPLQVTTVRGVQQNIGYVGPQGVAENLYKLKPFL